MCIRDSVLDVQGGAGQVGCCFWPEGRDGGVEDGGQGVVDNVLPRADRRSRLVILIHGAGAAAHRVVPLEIPEGAQHQKCDFCVFLVIDGLAYFVGRQSFYRGNTSQSDGKTHCLGRTLEELLRDGQTIVGGGARVGYAVGAKVGAAVLLALAGGR